MKKTKPPVEVEDTKKGKGKGKDKGKKKKEKKSAASNSMDKNLQLEVDGIESTTDKRRQRRKKLNARIQESIAHLEAESAVQPEQNDMKGYSCKL